MGAQRVERGLQVTVAARRLQVAGVGDGHAHLGGHRPGELLAASEVAVDGALQQIYALRDRGPGPVVSGTACRGDGAGRVSWTAEGDRVDDLLGGRVDHFERRGLDGTDPGAVDVVLIQVCHAEASHEVGPYPKQLRRRGSQPGPALSNDGSGVPTRQYIR